MIQKSMKIKKKLKKGKKQKNYMGIAYRYMGTPSGPRLPVALLQLFFYLCDIFALASVRAISAHW